MSRSVGIPLAAVLARRGALPPGEVVTLVVPLARALADRHRRGVAHGAVAPDTVVISTDGRPMLIGGGGASAQDDHRALIALAGAALGRGATGPVADALRSGAVGDDLAAALLAAGAPAPISIGDAVPPAPPATPGSVPLRRWRTAAVGMLAIALVVVVGAASAGHASSRPRPIARPNAATVSPPTPARSTVPTAASSTVARPGEHWLHVVAALERRRVAAYAHDDPHLLSTVYLGSSPELAADLRLLRRQLRGGSRAGGLRSKVIAVHVVSATARQVRLVVVDAWSSYDVVRAGHVVRHGDGRRMDRVVMVLRRVGRAWRILSVAA